MSFLSTQLCVIGAGVYMHFSLSCSICFPPNFLIFVWFFVCLIQIFYPIHNFTAHTHMLPALSLSLGGSCLICFVLSYNMLKTNTHVRWTRFALSTCPPKTAIVFEWWSCARKFEFLRKVFMFHDLRLVACLMMPERMATNSSTDLHRGTESHLHRLYTIHVFILSTTDIILSYLRIAVFLFF